MAIKLGSNVKDSVTGYEGVAMGRTTWLYGCVRINIQGPVDKDGKVPDMICFDEDQLITVKKPKLPKKKDPKSPPAGDRPMSMRRKDPAR